MVLQQKYSFLYRICPGWIRAPKRERGIVKNPSAEILVPHENRENLLYVTLVKPLFGILVSVLEPGPVMSFHYKLNCVFMVNGDSFCETFRKFQNGGGGNIVQKYIV